MEFILSIHDAQGMELIGQIKINFNTLLNLAVFFKFGS